MSEPNQRAYPWCATYEADSLLRRMGMDPEHTESMARRVAEYASAENIKLLKSLERMTYYAAPLFDPRARASYSKHRAQNDLKKARALLKPTGGSR